NGASVRAAPQFRMNGGFQATAAYLSKLDAIASKANVPASAVYQSKTGRPSPGQLHATVQPLIDSLVSQAGVTYTSISDGATYSLATTEGLRKMMFDYGV